MSLLDLKHSGKLCEDLIIRGSNDGSNGNDTEAALKLKLVHLLRYSSAFPRTRTRTAFPSVT